MPRFVLVGGPYAAFHHRADLSRYSYEVKVPTTSLEAWRTGGWREQPSARSELGGDAEEHFTVQWAGTRAHVADVLMAEGWQTARGLRPASILSTLLPTATSTAGVMDANVPKARIDTLCRAA